MTSETPREDNYTGETPEEKDFPVIFTQVRHSWKSKGNEVTCVICPNPHGVSLPPGWHLTGVDDEGMPELTQVW